MWPVWPDNNPGIAENQQADQVSDSVAPNTDGKDRDGLHDIQAERDGGQDDPGHQ